MLRERIGPHLKGPCGLRLVILKAMLDLFFRQIYAHGRPTGRRVRPPARTSTRPMHSSSREKEEQT
jgi:hypothetical protein